jgi:hypothetical protein
MESTMVHGSCFGSYVCWTLGTIINTQGGATITAKVVCHSITYFTRPFKNDLKVIFLHYLHIPICYVITFFYESSSIRVMVFNATFNNVSVISNWMAYNFCCYCCPPPLCIDDCSQRSTRIAAKAGPMDHSGFHVWRMLCSFQSENPSWHVQI